VQDLTIRAPAPGDVPGLAALVAEGFETYRSFAPAGWEPPPLTDHERYLTDRLCATDTWATVAEQRGTHVGIVSMIPAATSRVPVDDPRLAHLWQLFVAEPWWGTGLAPRLHALVTAAAAHRGFTAMRLFTPADQARARRFYEREGWDLVAGPQEDDIGFPVVEYRLRLA
jgi:GNAT superfamily N-acetyltransferase